MGVSSSFYFSPFLTVHLFCFLSPSVEFSSLGPCSLCSLNYSNRHCDLIASLLLHCRVGYLCTSLVSLTRFRENISKVSCGGDIADSFIKDKNIYIPG